MTTFAPFRANNSATARPIPRPPPVTSATLPKKLNGFSLKRSTLRSRLPFAHWTLVSRRKRHFEQEETERTEIYSFCPSVVSVISCKKTWRKRYFEQEETE